MLTVSGDAFSLFSCFFKHGRTESTVFFKSWQIYISLSEKCYFYQMYFYFAVKNPQEFELDLYYSMPLGKLRITTGPHSSTPLHKKYIVYLKIHSLLPLSSFRCLKNLSDSKAELRTFMFKRFHGSLAMVLLKSTRMGTAYPHYLIFSYSLLLFLRVLFIATTRGQRGKRILCRMLLVIYSFLVTFCLFAVFHLVNISLHSQFHDKVSGVSSVIRRRWSWPWALQRKPSNVRGPSKILVLRDFPGGPV